MTQQLTEKCARFFEHWKSIRAGNSILPLQSEFLDNSNPEFAPFIYISEIAENDVLVRLMGTGLVDRWGRDKTGESLFVDQPTDVVDAIRSNFKTAAALPCGYSSVTDYASNTGRHLVVVVINLPLATDSEKITRIVSYADLIQRLGHMEVTQKFLGKPKSEWIDLGAGVPAITPS